MLRQNKLSIRVIILTSIVHLVTYRVGKVYTEDFVYGSEPSLPGNNVYGSEKDNNCQNNELNALLDYYGNLQTQALRRRLWRMLSSPTLSDDLVVPNYEALSDGKLHYDAASQNNGDLRNWWHPNFKRNIGAILKSKSVPHSLKRSIATLAKNGQLPIHLPEDEVENDGLKRNSEGWSEESIRDILVKKSLQALAKNSHFPDKSSDDNPDTLSEYSYDHMPVHYYYYDVGKKNIESLMRSGQLLNHHRGTSNENKRNIQYVMKNGGVTSGGKRNIASLVKNHNMPETIRDEPADKRNIGAIARDWALPNHSHGWIKNSEEKRNVAALLRQTSYPSGDNSGKEVYPTPSSEEDMQFEYKRNLASIKAGKRALFKRSLTTNKDKSKQESSRAKRQADEYFTENAEDYNPVIHKTSGIDYDEFTRAAADDFFYYPKRFLGNIPLSRMTELGKISLMGLSPVSNATPTSPTYRRKQYLLSRSVPSEQEEN